MTTDRQSILFDSLMLLDEACFNLICFISSALLSYGHTKKDEAEFDGSRPIGSRVNKSAWVGFPLASNILTSPIHKVSYSYEYNALSEAPVSRLSCFV